MTEPRLNKFSILAIGCSAGGFDSLRTLLPGLGPDFPLPVVIVIHLPPERDSFLPQAFERSSPLRVKEAEDKETLLPGIVYFAPPSYHLLVERGGSFALSVDEPVHFSRPSIDVLFESVAMAYGPRALGIVLSGANADGAEGLRTIVEAGGFAAVEDPATAAYQAMPAAAKAIARPQRCLSIEALSAWLKDLPRT